MTTSQILRLHSCHRPPCSDGGSMRLSESGASRRPLATSGRCRDPVGIGLVMSLAWPGGNATGNSLMSPELSAKRLEILRAFAPTISHFAILWASSNPGMAQRARENRNRRRSAERISRLNQYLRARNAILPAIAFPAIECPLRMAPSTVDHVDWVKGLSDDSQTSAGVWDFSALAEGSLARSGLSEGASRYSGPGSLGRVFSFHHAPLVNQRQGRFS
jgi:hypothetical protein